MATYNYPGVYVEEVASGVRPIEAVGTSTTAFFGVAQRGPIGSVKRIFNFTEFRNTYGDFFDGYYLAHAVYQFFNNGGTQCYVGRIASGADTANVTILDRGNAAQDSLTISAVSPGAWGNKLMAIVDSTAAEDPANQFNLTVFQDNPKADEDPTQLEVFEDLNMGPNSPNYVETVINSGSQYIRIKVNTANTNQTKGYSESGEITLNGKLLGDNQRKFRINIHGDSYRIVDLTAELQGKDVSKLDVIKTAIQKTIRALKPLRESTPSDAYNVTVSIQETNRLRVTSGHKSADSKVEIIDAESPLENATGALRLGRRNGGSEIFGSSPMRSQNTDSNDFYFLGDDKEEGNVS